MSKGMYRVVLVNSDKEIMQVKDVEGFSEAVAWSKTSEFAKYVYIFKAPVPRMALWRKDAEWHEITTNRLRQVISQHNTDWREKLYK